MDILKNRLKNLLDKYIPLSKKLPKDEEESKRFLSYFSRLQTKIDEINDFGRLNKLYNKLKKTIQMFISYYNKRNDDKISKEKFIDIKQIEEVELNTENIILKIPKITFYNGHKYGKKIQILKSEIDEEKTNFFTYLLKYMENGIENIKKAYSNTATSKDIYENSINEFLKDGFSRKFNELSSKIFGNYEYDFRIKFEGGLIRLSIKKDNEPITLSQQSQGFQWFFGLFFLFIL